MRWLAAIPGFIWLLLPPICICHLPERLMGTYEQPAPWEDTEDNHAPGCPAGKKMQQHNFAEWDDPRSSDADTVCAVLTTELDACPSPWTSAVGALAATFDPGPDRFLAQPPLRL